MEVKAQQGKKVELEKKQGGLWGIFCELAIGPGQEMEEVFVLIMVSGPV